MQNIKYKLPDKAVRLVDLMYVMLRQLSVWNVLCLLFASACVTVIGMAVPYATNVLFKEVIPSGQNNLLLPIGMMLVGAAIAAAAFEVIKSLLLIKLRNRMSIALQSALMERVLKLPARFFRDFSAGSLGERLMQICAIMQMFAFKTMSAMLALIFCMLYFLQVNSYTPQLVVVCVVAFFVQIGVMALYLHYASKEQNRIRTADSELSGLLFNMLGGMHKIKTSNAEQRIYDLWAKQYHEALTERPDRNRMLVAYPAINALIAMVTTVLTYAVAMRYNVDVAAYAAYLAAYGMVTMAIGMLSGMLPELTALKPAFDLCKPMLTATPEMHDDREHVEQLTGEIDVHDMSFRYHEKAPYVFKNLNLHIKSGEYVAVVGASGCGKSTLLRLLLGFETPENGTVAYDGKQLEALNMQSLRKRIGVCLQNGSIFQGSIRENIIVTKPDATDDEVMEAIRLACFDDDLAKMPMGLHTIVGEMGGGLSGGQCQRLLLARMLVAIPDVIVLDEATSALDNTTQRRVTENLNNLNCTRIVVAHRLSTIRHCDRIIVLDNGGVAEEGTYDELMAKKTRFYSLVKKQVV